MNIISKKKYLNIKQGKDSKAIKQKKSDNKPEITEDNIMYNKFGFPTELSQKHNKNKPS
jgi:hypothetical protein